MNFSHSSQPEIARSNITTIIYNSCTENRSTQVCHQFPADLVTFTEKIVNGKLHFLCVANYIPHHDFLEEIAFSTLYSCIVFQWSFCDFNCFSWINLCPVLSIYLSFYLSIYLSIYCFLTHMSIKCAIYEYNTMYS